MFSRLNNDSGFVSLMPTVGQLEEDVDFVAVKTRSNTPDGASGGPYWMPPGGSSVGGAPRHPMEGCETGFINSQPSMAEVGAPTHFFLTIRHIKYNVYNLEFCLGTILTLRSAMPTLHSKGQRTNNGFWWWQLQFSPIERNNVCRYNVTATFSHHISLFPSAEQISVFITYWK